MVAATFDTLKFANTLKAAGVPDKQAEAQAVAFADIIQLNLKDLVNRSDLDLLEKTLLAELDRFAKDHAKELQREIKQLREELQREIKDLGVAIRSEMKDLGVAIRSEMKDLGVAIRSEMKDMGTAIRTDMATQVSRLDLKISKVTGDLAVLKWMTGAVLTLMTAYVVRFIYYSVR